MKPFKLTVVRRSIQETHSIMPGSKDEFTVAAESGELIKIDSNNTWIPDDVIHNGDKRALSVAIKVENSPH